jgi:hypothetical protein
LQKSSKNPDPRNQKRDQSPEDAAGENARKFTLKFWFCDTRKEEEFDRGLDEIRHKVERLENDFEDRGVFAPGAQFSFGFGGDIDRRDWASFGGCIRIRLPKPIPGIFVD